MIGFNEIPDEIVLHILAYLDGNSLKEAALVCTEWSSIINCSAALMNKFTLNLVDKKGDNRKWINNMEEILNLERSFQEININFYPCEEDSCEELFDKIIDRHGAQIRRLIMNWGLFESQYFVGILQKMPLLEYLEIYRTRFSPHKTELKLVKLKKLSHLFLNSSSWMFVDSLECQLKILRIIGSSTDASENSATSLVCFLLRCQESLESLRLNAHTLNHVISSKIELLFHLKELDVNVSNLTDELEADFIKFLTLQSSFLEVLHIKDISSPPILLTVFSKLTKLRKLGMSGNMLPANKEFYSQLVPLKSLRELTLSSSFMEDIAAEGILGNCPEIETFKMDMLYVDSKLSSDLIQFMSINNLNLRSVSLYTIRFPVGPEVKFKLLKNFHVRFLLHPNYWLNFILNNPSIETVEVDELPTACKESIVQVLKIILDQPNIKNLKFGEVSDGNDQKQMMKFIFDTIRAHGIYLKSFQIVLLNGNNFLKLNCDGNSNKNFQFP